MKKAYTIVVSALTVWLLAWIVLSWSALQDDALIHLRYAAHLQQMHQVSYDGIHPDYGASSLLYIYLLAFLRNFFRSPSLPRAVSSVAHLVLFISLAWMMAKSALQTRPVTRVLSILILMLVAAPSAVRWLDDGMETGLALCCVVWLCWMTFRQTEHPESSAVGHLRFFLAGLVCVILRTELALLCGLVFGILVSKSAESSFVKARTSSTLQVWWWAALQASPVVVGAGTALLCIVLKMHVLLPDTALAKSHGVGAWEGVFVSTATVLVGALSFGVGVLLLWLLSCVLVLRAHRLSLALILANAVFPITLFLAALRGQEIQGVRYFIWTFFFSILWNILELHAADQSQQHAPPDRFGYRLTLALLALLILIQPLESKWMYRVLTGRAHTLTYFEGQHLDRLQHRLGVAFDVGYIGYFSQAQICDLAGLVNGRSVARMTNQTRAEACAARHPGFIFGNLTQLDLMGEHMSLAGWQVCDQYNLINLRQLDTHYLLLPPADAVSLCRSIAGRDPYPAQSILLHPFTR